MTTRRDGGLRVTVETTSAPQPECPGCGQRGILSALVPVRPGPGTDGTPGSAGTDRPGPGRPGLRRGLAVLCEQCDIDDPDAGPLIAYFAVHGAIGPDTVEQGTALVASWLSSAPVKVIPGGSAPAGPER